jgi:hypothetical protein
MNIPKLSPPVFSYFRTWLRPISSNRPLTSSIEFILTKFDYLEKHFLSLLTRTETPTWLEKGGYLHFFGTKGLHTVSIVVCIVLVIGKEAVIKCGYSKGLL